MKVCFIVIPGENDSLRTRQVYLPTIVEYVPPDMVKSAERFSGLRQRHTCRYLRHPLLLSCTFTGIPLRCVHETLSLPRQRPPSHQPHNIREFGAPGGLRSSINSLATPTLSNQLLAEVKLPRNRGSSENYPFH